MSLHNRPEFNTPGIIDGLKLHGMEHDTPSQLADAFRQGYVYAMTPPTERPTEKATHWMDARGLVVTDDWLRNDPRSTSDYRAAYNIPCVKRRGKYVPI